jgi:hypothetical protein
VAAMSVTCLSGGLSEVLQEPTGSNHRVTPVPGPCHLCVSSTLGWTWCYEESHPIAVWQRGLR